MSMRCIPCPFCHRELCLDREAGRAAHTEPPCDDFLKMVGDRPPVLANDAQLAAVETARRRYRERPILSRRSGWTLLGFGIGAMGCAMLLGDWFAVVWDSAALVVLLLVDRLWSRS